MKSAGKARNNGLYRHIRTSKEIIRNLLNDLHNYFHLGEGDGKIFAQNFLLKCQFSQQMNFARLDAVEIAFLVIEEREYADT